MTEWLQLTAAWPLTAKRVGSRGGEHGELSPGWGEVDQLQNSEFPFALYIYTYTCIYIYELVDHLCSSMHVELKADKFILHLLYFKLFFPHSRSLQ